MEATHDRKLENGEATETFECTKYLCSILPRKAGAAAFWALHLDMAVSDRQPGRNSQGGHQFAVPTSHGLTAFLASLRDGAGTAETASVCLVLPLDSGHAVRSDFLPRRLECCDFVLGTASFIMPIGFVKAVPWPPAGELSPANLGDVAVGAVGAIHVRSGTTTSDVNRELHNRLSFPWLLADGPIRPRRVAWVQGREDAQSIRRALEAAAALGIRLVVLDEPGHWLQVAASAHLREDFVEVDLTPDPGLGERIAAAVRAYPRPIDGIVTISDVRLAAVARASRELGLPTEAPEAYNIAANKGRTRMLEEEGRAAESGSARESFVLYRAEDLQLFLEEARGQDGSPLLTFPRIVKPVVGWSSECVARVRSEEELAAAVKRASDRHAASATPSTAVVVEPYVAGPEVDANLVLLDGEVLFCDISDDFPCEGDRAGAGLWANFEETQNVMPSALPAAEQTGIRARLLQSVTNQGFRTGVFHCEARVRNSRCSYRTNREGFLDLVPNDTGAIGDDDERVDVYLHEVNARPPGYLESIAVLLTYGVDYYALRLLTAIGGDQEEARIRALSQPFLEGPQFHLSLLMVHQGQAGIMRSRDAVGEFLEAHPDVKANVVDYYSRKKGGDVLEGQGSSALCWVGFLSVVSRQSRADLLRRVAHVANQLTYEMETTDGRLIRVRGLRGDDELD